MNSIVLVGMPGAGKSTVGVILAKKTAKAFIDTDLLIQNHAGKTLQELVNESGYLALREIEGQLLAELTADNSVIATGGSAVYSPKAMAQLQSQGRVIYLRASLETLQQRINNLDSRGLACPPGQSLSALYSERTSLYEKYADEIIDCDSLTAEQVADEVVKSLEKGGEG